MFSPAPLAHSTAQIKNEKDGNGMYEFIEITERESGTRMLIPINEIKSVIELEDGAFIELSSSGKDKVIGVETSDSYDNVVRAICPACED